MRKQTFENNIYMKLFRWAYIFLMSSLCFTLVNLPFFFATISLAIDLKNTLFFLVALLFWGPGMIALIAMIDRFKEEKDVQPVKYFFSAFRQFWLRGLIYWLIGWFSIVVALTDVAFFAKLPNGQWFIPLFLVLAIVGLSFSINSWYFQVRNPESGIKSVMQMAIFYVLRKWYFSLLNSLLFLIIPLLMILKPQFGFTITPSLFAGLIYLNATQLHRRKSVTN
ncbi:DUF624 domain-containing protein [Enterococcus songbeiensis]|uniref:DUF624 domain-containing protein n=1 Tax=Enterococcus songbeiensis TaxID=2559927 RepID=UPI001FEC1D4A|nr:DUF624 domain-containing protein [Enterococcus songbeiensis]